MTREGPVEEEDVAELLEELEELEETAETAGQRRVIRRTIDTVGTLSRGRIFGFDDLAQQIVGGVLLSAPFVVTEEVWSLAATMTWLQWAVTVVMVVAIGYGTLYRADERRDPDREESVGGLPLRFVSLIFVAYLSVTTLAFVVNAPATFDATPGTTLKAVSIGAIFSVVGASTADSVF